MTDNLPCTAMETSPTGQIKKFQSKDSDNEVLAECLKQVKTPKPAQFQSKSPPAPCPAPGGRSKKDIKVSLASKSPATPSRPSPPIHRTGALETPVSRPLAHPSSRIQVGGSSPKVSSRRPTQKALPPVSPIRSRLSTPRTNTFKRPLIQKNNPDVSKNTVKDSSKRTPTPGRPTASLRPIGRDSKKRRGVIMVRKDPVQILVSARLLLLSITTILNNVMKTKDVPRTFRAEIHHPMTSRISESADVFVVEGNGKSGELKIDRKNMATDITMKGRSIQDLEECANSAFFATTQDCQGHTAETIMLLPTETVVARLVEAFSGSDLGSLEMTDSDASEPRDEHIRLVFQGNLGEASGSPSIFPSLRQNMVEEIDASETVGNEFTNAVDEFESTPVAAVRVRRVSRPDTPTPMPRSMPLLSESESKKHDAVSKSTIAASHIAMSLSSDLLGHNLDGAFFTVVEDSSTPMLLGKPSFVAVSPVSHTTPRSDVSSEIVKSSGPTACISKSLKGPWSTQDGHTITSTARTLTGTNTPITCMSDKDAGSHKCVSSLGRNLSTDFQLQLNAALQRSPTASEPPAVGNLVLTKINSVGQVTKASSTHFTISLPAVRQQSQRPEMVKATSTLPSTPPKPRAESLTEAASPSQFTTKARSNTIDLYLPTPQSPLSRLVTDFSAGSKSRSRAGSVKLSTPRQLPSPHRSSGSGEKSLTVDSRRRSAKNSTTITKPILPLHIQKKSTFNKSKPSSVPQVELSLLATIPCIPSAPPSRTQRVTSSTASLIPNWTTSTKNGALTPLQRRKLFNSSMSMAAR